MSNVGCCDGITELEKAEALGNGVIAGRGQAHDDVAMAWECIKHVTK